MTISDWEINNNRLHFKEWRYENTTPQLNWISNPDDVFSAMALMEGESWEKRQDLGEENSLPKSIEWMKKQISRLQSETSPESPEYEKELEHVATTVYGAGGWHRYFLNGNGRVDFSHGHAAHRRNSEDIIQNAIDLGFNIFY